MSDAATAAPDPTPDPTPVRWGLRLGLIGFGVAVAALLVALLIVVAGGADDDYAQKSRSTLDDLTTSATVIATGLGKATDAKDVARVRDSAERQLELLKREEGELRALIVSDDERPAHEALKQAVGAHRDFLLLLVTTGKAPAAKATGNIAPLTDRARAMLDQYRAFLLLAPDAADDITQTGLIKNIATFRTALAAKRDAERASAVDVTPSPTSPGAAAVTPGSFAATSAGFITPSGKNMCRAMGDGSVLCRSTYPTAAVIGPSGPASSVADPGAAMFTGLGRQGYGYPVV